MSPSIFTTTFPEITYANCQYSEGETRIYEAQTKGQLKREISIVFSISSVTVPGHTAEETNIMET